ncbi:MAG: DUF983 domain-containing protein [Flavobacteriaceae bacterium]|nr:DUF983 domain-containing protein [Flavobacteriaceae bacterium]
MLKKGGKAYSILKNKCPKCNEGKFFEDDNPLHLKKVLKMPEHCAACGFKYQIEPSFFYGAMYVSYAITVALSILTFIILYALDLELLQIFIGIIAVLILFTPFTLRLSRLVYINIFVGFDAEYRNENGIKAAKMTALKSSQSDS